MLSRRPALLLAFAALLAAPLRAADRYVAWLADGTQLSSRTLSAWPVPGIPYRFADRDLFAAANPVRLVRDHRTAQALQAPYVALANGDLVGGQPVRLEPDGGRVGQTPRLRVQLEPPLIPVTGAGLAVRTDRVQRLAIRPDSTASPPPGTVVLADGRRLMARAIRWREYGLAILTAGGIIEADFGDLSDVVFPGVDLAAAVLDDNLWAAGTTGAAIARFQTASGAVVTAARVSREQEQARRRGRLTNTTYYYVQPAWADQPLAIPEQDLVCCGYRAADEAPLTMFSAVTLANLRMIGQPEPWTANRSADGGLLAAARRESDLGIAAHAHSAIAFQLPKSAQTLEAAVGLDRTVGGGGCVRCKIMPGDSATTEPLWDSGVIQGKDGLRGTGRLDVAGLDRVVLVTEFAHDDRPSGADPFDIRDRVVWLAPLVKLSPGGATSRALAVLAGALDWEPSGESWRSVQIANRWNVPASHWDSVLSLASGNELRLKRSLRVTRASDVLELLTVCPIDLDEHDFTLKVNGTVVPWHNNADRNQLRQWTLRYSRTRARDGEEESNLTDRLAYWWDLQNWRGQEVTLELTLRGARERNEIAWRGLSVRSAIGNLPADGQPIAADVPLVSLPPLDGALRQRGQALKDAVPGTRESEPIRFLGQQFTGGYGLARSSSISFALEAEYREFVAVVGCTLQMAGPVQVLIDDRVVWERAAISSLSPAEQIEIAIPAGAKTLTLQSGSESLYYGAAAFAEAGFVTK